MAYQVGSFRGVRFRTRSVESQGGGLNILHEFAGDLPAQAEPMGRHTARFSIDAIIGGENYDAALAALVEELDTPGPGKLIHPYWGERTVALAEPYRIVESTAEGGIARVTLVFAEVGEQPEPPFSVDTQGILEGLRDAVNDSLSPNLFDLDGPNFIADAVNAILAGPRSVTATLAKVNSRISQTIGSIDSISNAIDDFTSELQTLLATPASLWTSIKGLQNSLFRLLDVAGFDTSSKRGDEVDNLARSRVALQSLNTIAKFGDGQDDVEATTGNREKQRDNQRELIDLVEVSGLAEGAVAIGALPLDNPEQAADIVEQVGDLFDRILERGTISDETDQRLRSLRSTFYRRMQEQAVTAPVLVRYTPPQTIPALALAYQLYGDATREQDIIDRNRIAHPLFVPGSVELQVSGA